jgi:ATP-dependent RNA helicase HelY
VAVVVSEHRPVPLFQNVLVGHTLHDLFATVENGREEVNPTLTKIAREESRFVRDDSRRPRGKTGRGRRTVGFGSGAYGGAAHRSSDDYRPGRPRSLRSVSRPELVELLDDDALLPAIVFIFSRVGCDAAVRQLLGSGLRLTDDDEQAEISAILERHVAGLADADLRALEYDLFAEALLRGVAAHHAGMLPTFKECVEEAFVRGLVKAVFATETLALGINMPARSVVLERLVKYNGESHADVTPGEYTQLTGRAGRRGIDVEGHAVVLWQPGLDPRAVAGLASRRTYPLTSSFTPTYNMAVNLVATVGRARARTLLEQSFAQFQSDRSVVGISRTLARNAAAIQAAFAAATCDRGNFVEYARLRAQIGEFEAEAARDRASDRRAESLRVLANLKPGDIVWVPGGKSRGWVLVLDPGTRDRRDSPRPLVLTQERQVRRLSILDFPTSPSVAGRMKIGKHADPREPAARRNLAAALRSKLAELDLDQARRVELRTEAEPAVRIQELRERLRAHPCHSCPDRETHARWAERALQLERENARLEARVAARTSTIATHFDKICQVLESLGYLVGDGGSQVSDAGRMLARVYAELDLVAAETIRAGVLDTLTAPQLAGVLAALVYETRRSDDGPRKPRLPDAATSEAVAEVRRIWREVSLVERDAKLHHGPEPDIGFSEVAYGWAAGRSLTSVLSGTDLTAGDFVRWVRQVIDFAGQIADAVGPGPLRETAREAVRSMRRGVVTYAPEIDETEGDDIDGSDYL